MDIGGQGFVEGFLDQNFSSCLTVVAVPSTWQAKLFFKAGAQVGPKEPSSLYGLVQV